MDDFAEGLKRLYARAYAERFRMSVEAERMGEMILANQFIAGLLPSLKAKIVGSEGTMDQMLLKARFEEAKSKELRSVTKGPPPKRVDASANPSPVITGALQSKEAKEKGKSKFKLNGEKSKKCFNCGMGDRFKRDCPYPKQAKQSEAHGRKSVATLTGGTQSVKSLKGRIKELKCQIQAAELVRAVEDASGVVYGVEPAQTHEGATLGPTLHAIINVNGVAATALIDTRSPATILSLEFLLGALAKNRPDGQTREQWKEDILTRFSAPKVKLNSYGSHQLDIIAQILLSFSQSTHSVDAVVLIQKGAPNDLLLGTDLQRQLGFLLTIEKATGHHVDIHDGANYCVLAAGTSPDSIDQSTQTIAEQQSGVVSLIAGVKIPPRHQKLVRARVKGVAGMK